MVPGGISFSGGNPVSGHIKTIQGTNDTGFIGKNYEGSQTTFFCDKGEIFMNRGAGFGGDGRCSSDGGAFYLSFLAENWESGARLMFKHKG